MLIKTEGQYTHKSYTSLKMVTSIWPNILLMTKIIIGEQICG